MAGHDDAGHGAEDEDAVKDRVLAELEDLMGGSSLAKRLPKAKGALEIDIDADPKDDDDEVA